MNATPLFLHIGKLPNATRAKIEKAGYVPVQVTAFDSCKIITPIEGVDVNAVAKCAFESIGASAYSSVQEDFGKRVSKALSKEAAK